MKNTKNKYCIAPFAMYQLHADQDFVCCPSWNNHPTLSGSNILERFNSKESKEIRNSILDGSYRYCKDSCPFLKSYRECNDNPYFVENIEDYFDLSSPLFVVSAEDRTCNLACPTCRKDFILDSESDRNLEEELLSVSNLKTFVTSGSGDPLYNKKTFSMLQNMNIIKFPNLKNVEIHTNGILLNEKNYNKLKHLPLEISISIDAANKETYTKVRRGGSWEVLMKNLDFLNTTTIKNLNLHFVVQKENFNEILDFYNFMEEKLYNLNKRYYFLNIENWWMTEEQFSKFKIPDEYSFEEVKTQLSDEIKSGKVVINL